MNRSNLRRTLMNAAERIPDDDLLRLDAVSRVHDKAANGRSYNDKDRAHLARLRVVDMAMVVAPGPGRSASNQEGLFVKRDGRGRAYVDSQTLLFFARELEYVMTQVEREEFPDLRMANGEILPINSSVPEGARTFTYYMLGAVGVARFLAGYAANNLPTVDLKRVRMTGQIQPFGTSYTYTTEDIRHAQYTGFGLEAELAIAARRAVEELINRTGLWGVPELNLPGLLNHPNINRSDAAASTGANAPATDWPSKTSEEVIADVNDVIMGVDEVTFGKEMVNTVLMSRRAWNHIATRRLNASGDLSTTILDHLETIWGKPRNGRPAVSFEILDELAAANSDDHLETDAMFAYTRGNASKAELIVPMLFRQYPPQQDGLTFKVPVEGTTGGVKLTRPLGCHLVTGVYEAA